MEDEDVVVEVEVVAVVVAVHMADVHTNEVAHHHGLLQMPMMILSPSRLLRPSGILATRNSYLIMN